MVRRNNRRQGESSSENREEDEASSESNDGGLYSTFTRSWPGLLILAIIPIDVEIIDALIYLKRIITGPNRLNQLRKFLINLVWFIDDIITLFLSGGLLNFLPLADKETVRIGKKALPKKWVKKLGRIKSKLPDWLQEDIRDKAKEKSKEKAREKAENMDSPANTGTTSSDRRWTQNNDVTRRDPIEQEENSSSLSISSGTIRAGAKLVGMILGIVILVGGLGIVGSAAAGGGGHLAILNNMLGSETSQAAGAVSGLAETAGYKGSQFLKTVQCFDDAGCLREWRLNNTREPGSEDVGETYRLRASNVQVGVGNSINIGYEIPERGIPVSFLLKNSRNQLKGYPAKEVDYRVRIADTSLLDSDEDQCNSGWIELKKYGNLTKDGTINESDIGEGNANDWLLPGETVEPSSYKGEERNVTLQDCGLLQPGPSRSYDVLIQIRYNYSSTSLLQIEAMSEQYRTEEEITIENKRSEAVRTPAQSYINANEPLTYSRVGEEEVTQPRVVNVGVSTDENGIEYKISDPKSFNFTDSSLTEEVEDDCRGLVERDGDENTYKLSEDAIQDIEERQSENWLDNRAAALGANCDFRLSDPNRISSTGETLTFTAEADYRIEMSKKRQSFNIKNTRCIQENCPTLAPITTENSLDNITDIDLNEDAPTTDSYFEKEYAYCNRNEKQDAQDGCDVLQYKDEDQNEYINPFTKRQTIGETIEEGNLAVTAGALTSTGGTVTCHAEDQNPSGVFGLDPDDLEEAVQSSGTALNYTNGEWNDVDLDPDEDRMPGSCDQAPE